MNRKLAVLIIGESANDAGLVVRRLTEAGFEVELEVVDNEAALREARHRATEAALTSSEKDRELLATALNSAATPVAICDGQGTIAWINSAFTACTGFESREAVGRNLRKLIDSEKNAPALRKAQIATLQAGLSWSGEMINRRKDGSTYPDHVTLTPVRDDSGKVVHFIAIMHDLSEQRRLEVRMHESHRLESIGQLTGGIAHDFNNLLTVIIGNAELLAEQLEGQVKLAPLAKMICSAAERGADLTRSLLAFARRQELAPQVVDVNRLIHGMERLLHHSLGEHIEIQVDTRANPGEALIDPAELESALLNLCLNARDAMPGGGRLAIETTNCRLGEKHVSRDLELLPGNYVMVAVSDSGSGIAPEHREHIFEPFFTTKDKGKGTGLGLPRVYGFIKQSGGQIHLYSEPGRGTTVKMYLPYAGGSTPRGESADETSRVIGGHETILLVEDDEQVRAFASEQLAALGYEVIVAGAGAAALEIIRRRDDIDLLFTDMIMPGGMHGHELAAAAASIRPGLKMLFTSGYTDTILIGALHLDANLRLLWKPYRKADLAAEVRGALDDLPA